MTAILVSLVIALLSLGGPAPVVVPASGVQCERAGRERCAGAPSEENGSYPPQAVVEVLVSDGPREGRGNGRPAHLHGNASWVRASLGDRYLAARVPRGTVLRVCGALGCVTRAVTDYGPSKRVHPDRIVDLSRHDFSRVCGDPEALGVCAVTVETLDIVPPATDVAPPGTGHSALLQSRAL